MADSETEDPRPPGMLVAPNEFEIVSDGLSALADQATKSNRADIASFLRTFIVKLRHHTWAGNGIDQPLLERLCKKIERGFLDGDYEAARIGFGAIIAAVLRMDPDPAAYLAQQLAPLFVNLTMQSAVRIENALLAKALKDFSAHLEKERKILAANDWKDATPASIFDYLRDLATFCAATLEIGEDPYADREGDDDGEH